MKDVIAQRCQLLVGSAGRIPAALLLLTMALLPVAPSAAVITAYAALLASARSNRFRWWPGPGFLRSPFPWMMAFFLMHVIGMLWTSDTGFGLFDLQIKAALFLLPLLAMMAGPSWSRGRDLLLFIFSIACAVMVLVCTLASLVRIVGESALSPAQEIFSSYWSLALHPSYFALYSSTAIGAWCLLDIHRWLPRMLSTAVLAVLCTGVVLSASKIGWLLLLPLLGAVLLLRWRQREVRFTLLGMAALSTIGVAGLITLSPYARDRVQEMLRAVGEERHDAAAMTSSEVRWLTWGTAWELFKQAPVIGTGTGDIKNELVAAYVAHGYTGAAEKRLNAHDQYLQSAACLGVPGVLLALAMVLIPLFTLRPLEPLPAIFLVLNAANWVVESMLEVQAGAVFFAVIACLLPWCPAEARTSPKAA